MGVGIGQDNHPPCSPVRKCCQLREGLAPDRGSVDLDQDRVVKPILSGREGGMSHQVENALVSITGAARIDLEARAAGPAGSGEPSN